MMNGQIKLKFGLDIHETLLDDPVVLESQKIYEKKVIEGKTVNCVSALIGEDEEKIFDYVSASKEECRESISPTQGGARREEGMFICGVLAEHSGSYHQLDENAIFSTT